MKNFGIKDIVKLKENEKVLYMVVDYSDFTEELPNGKQVVDIDYELVQIFPVNKTAKYMIVSQNDIMIHANFHSKSHDICMSFVKKSREEIGLFGTPDYIETATSNIKAINRARKHVKVPPKKQDEIRYDSIDTIDSCLEALNDLDILYKMFGDDAYLQLKEVVTDRIIKLQE